MYKLKISVFEIINNHLTKLHDSIAYFCIQNSPNTPLNEQIRFEVPMK